MPIKTMFETSLYCVILTKIETGLITTYCHKGVSCVTLVLVIFSEMYMFSVHLVKITT